MFQCSDCGKFRHCLKNSESWEKATKLYPVTPEESNIDHHPMTENERARMRYMANIAGRCNERVTA